MMLELRLTGGGVVDGRYYSTCALHVRRLLSGNAYPVPSRPSVRRHPARHQGFMSASLALSLGRELYSVLSILCSFVLSMSSMVSTRIQITEIHGLLTQFLL